MGNPIIHFEVAGTDGTALETFYAELFKWKIDHQGEGDMQYGFISEGSAGAVGGGIRHEPDGKPEVVFYVEVDDVKLAIEHAKALGATVRIEPINTGDVTFGMIRDPQGNSVGLIERPDSTLEGTQEHNPTT
jgi:predicted enzyme related to lactoylglutathione lyase